MIKTSHELKELTHTALKMYVPEKIYEYICGMIDMAHMMGVADSPDTDKAQENQQTQK